jgi:hypothetical protein
MRFRALWLCAYVSIARCVAVCCGQTEQGMVHLKVVQAALLLIFAATAAATKNPHRGGGTNIARWLTNAARKGTGALLVAQVLATSTALPLSLATVSFAPTVALAQDGLLEKEGEVILADSSKAATATATATATDSDIPASSVLARPRSDFKKKTANILPSQMVKFVGLSEKKINVIKVYIDEAERNLFAQRWDRLQAYLLTLSERDKDFALLISQLFPNDDDLDGVAREALSFEAKSFFLALDDLKTATRDEDYPFAESSYAKMLLSYDRFLKVCNFSSLMQLVAALSLLYRRSITALSLLYRCFILPMAVL